MGLSGAERRWHKVTVTPLEFEPQVALAAGSESVNYFFKIWREGDLKLRPAFQRNLVWNLEQQSFLVDSILRGLPVPEIYIQKETSAYGEEKTIVVDGQQRISTCIRFILGRLRLVVHEDLDERWRGKTFEELADSLKKRFRSFNLIVRRLPITDDSVLREVFRRLNQTVEALEPQELRHAAYTGPFVRLIEQAAKQRILADIGIFSPKDYLRRRNDEFLAEIAFAVVSKAFPNKKEGLDQLFVTYEKQGIPRDDLEDLERRLGRVFATLDVHSASLRKTRFRNKSDFYSLFVYLARLAERLPLSEAPSEALAARLKEFSDRINEIKRTESEGKSVDPEKLDALGQEAIRYLRAVERAASDRLSRVRRQEALEGTFASILDDAVETDLTHDDASWRLAVDEDETGDELVPTKQDRAAAEQALLKDEPEI
jgi:hypothetical protein